LVEGKSGDCGKLVAAGANEFADELFAHPSGVTVHRISELTARTDQRFRVQVNLPSAARRILISSVSARLIAGSPLELSGPSPGRLGVKPVRTDF